MIFLFVSLFVPILIGLGLPPLTRLLGAKRGGGNAALLVACILFFVSWYVPSPDVFGQQTQASTHFIGGGLFSGFIWYYLKIRFAWRRGLLIEGASLYALVCMLGVTNELFELFTVKAGLSRLDLGDISIDLMVNTLGALAFFAVYAAVRLVRLHTTHTSTAKR